MKTKDRFERFGGVSAILVGLLSILYALFYLVIARQSEYVGTLGSWLILAASGIFSSAAYVGLFRRLKPAGEGFALWALVLGVASSLATLQHGAYQAIVVGLAGSTEIFSGVEAETVQQMPSQVDPGGLATFFLAALVALIFSWLILSSGSFSKNLGYLGIFNGLLLILLYSASVAKIQALILISGGLTSVVVGPIWWIWVGLMLLKIRPE